jgi:hypothetical protein
LSKVTTDADALEFDEALFAVRLERYFEPKALDLQQIVRVAKPRIAKAVEPFDPYKSVWAPRCKQADSQDLYDTDEVEFRRFSNDWEVLLRLGIIKLILKHDDGDDDGTRMRTAMESQTRWKTWPWCCGTAMTCCKASSRSMLCREAILTQAMYQATFR